MGGLEPLGGVGPKGRRHHLCHVAAETVHAFGCPEEQDIDHLGPRRWDRVEMVAASSGVIDAIVELHGLIPVVDPWVRMEAVVARTAGRLLLVASEVEGGLQRSAGTIVEVVLRVEVLGGVVVLSKVAHALGFADAPVLAGHVVRHEVDDDLQSCLVGTPHQCTKLLHAARHVFGQVGVDVVIVGDGVGRPCASLHDRRVLAGNGVGRVIGGGGVADDSCVPNMRNAQAAHLAQHLGIDVVHLPRTVLIISSTLLPGEVLIAKGAGEDLVYEESLTR